MIDQSSKVVPNTTEGYTAEQAVVEAARPSDIHVWNILCAVDQAT